VTQRQRNLSTLLRLVEDDTAALQCVPRSGLLLCKLSRNALGHPSLAAQTPESLRKTGLHEKGNKLCAAGDGAGHQRTVFRQ
jgi:hypothetical protein